jgi:hypothetical protein
MNRSIDELREIADEKAIEEEGRAIQTYWEAEAVWEDEMVDVKTEDLMDIF